VTYHANLTLNALLAVADPLLGIQFHHMGEKAADGLADKLDGRRLLDPFRRGCARMAIWA